MDENDSGADPFNNEGRTKIIKPATSGKKRKASEKDKKSILKTVSKQTNIQKSMYGQAPWELAVDSAEKKLYMYQNGTRVLDSTCVRELPHIESITQTKNRKRPNFTFANGHKFGKEPAKYQSVLKGSNAEKYENIFRKSTGIADLVKTLNIVFADYLKKTEDSDSNSGISDTVSESDNLASLSNNGDSAMHSSHNGQDSDTGGSVSFADENNASFEPNLLSPRIILRSPSVLQLSNASPTNIQYSAQTSADESSSRIKTSTPVTKRKEPANDITNTSISIDEELGFASTIPRKTSKLDTAPADMSAEIADKSCYDAVLPSTLPEEPAVTENVAVLEFLHQNITLPKEKLLASGISLPINLLIAPDPNFAIRAINERHVKELKNLLRQSNGQLGHIQVLTLLCDENGLPLSGNVDLNSDNFTQFRYMCIGGNHTRCAMQELASEMDAFRQKNVTAIVFSDLLQSEIYKLGFWHNKIQSQALRVTYVDRILNIRRILMHFTDGSTQSTTGITEPPLLSGEIIDHVVEALADTDMTSLKSEIPLAALPTKIFSLLEKLFKKIDLEEGAELNHKKVKRFLEINHELLVEALKEEVTRDKPCFDSAINRAIDLKEKQTVANAAMRGFEVNDFEDCKKRYSVTLDFLQDLYHKNGCRVGAVQQYAAAKRMKVLAKNSKTADTIDVEEKIEFFVGCRVNGANVDNVDSYLKDRGYDKFPKDNQKLSASLHRKFMVRILNRSKSARVTFRLDRIPIGSTGNIIPENKEQRCENRLMASQQCFACLNMVTPYQRETAEYDICFTCEDQKVYFSKGLLKYYSPVMAKLFANDFMENEKTEFKLPGKTSAQMALLFYNLDGHQRYRPLSFHCASILLPLIDEYQIDYAPILHQVDNCLISQRGNAIEAFSLAFTFRRTQAVIALLEEILLCSVDDLQSLYSTSVLPSPVFIEILALKARMLEGKSDLCVFCSGSTRPIYQCTSCHGENPFDTSKLPTDITDFKLVLSRFMS